MTRTGRLHAEPRGARYANSARNDLRKLKGLTNTDNFGHTQTALSGIGIALTTTEIVTQAPLQNAIDRGAAAGVQPDRRTGARRQRPPGHEGDPLPAGEP